MKTWLLTLLLVGCGGSNVPATPTGTAGTTPGTPVGGVAGATQTGTVPPMPTTSWACRSDVPVENLNGRYPPTELAMVDFTAYNYDGSVRTKDDLLGHVTVIWFYPAAGTAG